MADLAHDASGLASSEPAGVAAQQASQPASSDKGKLCVFISYSRNDIDFADQLVAALDFSGFECVIDREGIAGGEAWERRLGNLISQADTVAFVLSPNSARSETCAWEVKEATRLNKRILPVVCRPLEGVSPPPHLRDLNYIFFYKEPKVPGAGFGTGLASLITALNTDFDWLREHTRYLQRATEWDTGGQPANRLLSGDDIAQAKAWAARRPKSAPEPTTLQLDFIRASEEEAEQRNNEERRRLAERAEALAVAEEAQRKRGRLRNWLLVVMTLAAGISAWSYYTIRQEAKRADQFIDLVSSDDAGTRAMNKICEEAIKVTSTLATESDKTGMQSSLDRFWELYFGPMYIIELHQAKKSYGPWWEKYAFGDRGYSEIEVSMIRFGNALKSLLPPDGRSIEKATARPPFRTQLCSYALVVRQNCIDYLGIKAPEPCR
jgi:TIR domain-containing protein